MKFKKISIILIIIMIFNLLQPICVEATNEVNSGQEIQKNEVLQAFLNATYTEINTYKNLTAQLYDNGYADPYVARSIQMGIEGILNERRLLLEALGDSNNFEGTFNFIDMKSMIGNMESYTIPEEFSNMFGQDALNNDGTVDLWTYMFGQEFAEKMRNNEIQYDVYDFKNQLEVLRGQIAYSYSTMDPNNEEDMKKLLEEEELVLDENGNITIDDDRNVESTTTSENFEGINNEGSNVLLDVLGVAVDGIFGLILYPIKLVFIIIAILANSIATGVANLGGDIEVDRFTLLTPDMILFNKVPLLDIDVFNVNGNDTEAIKTLRTSIVDWFYVLRNLSIIISLCVLIYIGIRMAISSLAENQAKYKKMFLNWVVGVLLIFVLQFIIVITITINNNIVSVLEPQEVDISGQMNALLGASFWPSLTVGFGSAIVYALLIGINFAFLIIYIKRMITISFLIVISPLITVTYAIDKVGDGRSQALNTWLKEFIYNVLIQPFHCIIYLIFATTAINLMNVDGLESIGAESLGSAVFAIILIAFLFKAEDILRKIFGFEEASTLGSGLGSAIALGAGLSTLSNFAGKKQQSGGRTNNVPPAALKAMMPQVQNQPNTTNAQTTAGSSSQTQTSTSTGGTGNSQNSGNTAANASSQNNAPSRGAKFAGQVLQFYKNNTLNIGAAMFGAAMGASQGSLSGIVGGATAGGMISKGSLDKLGAFRERKQVQRNEEIYENAYEKYKIAMLAKNPSLTDEDLRFNTKYLLNVDDTSKIQDDDAREYAIYAQGLRNTYTAIGIKDADKAVIDELNYIQKSKKK